jgi:hypothetical protein
VVSVMLGESEPGPALDTAAKAADAALAEK